MCLSDPSDLPSESPQEVELRVRVMVVDPEQLVQYARVRHFECWAEEGWSPSDLAEAAMEALVNSNENPSPSDYGIEIVDWNAAVRRD